MADTQTIKDRIDIVQFIGEYITLKKAGSNWKARCPFHNEKSASFMVHPDKQIWHCFGCGKGGDIFTFVEEMEGLDFVEALKMLANRAGVALDDFKPAANVSQKNRLLEANRIAAYFFHHFLLEIPAAGVARDYLEKRGVTTKTIEDWQIGYSPEQWDLLTKYLLKKGFTLSECVASGLTIQRDGANASTGQGFYDRFRGRVMFPISDVHGNVIGFTGRVLRETETSGGKYVNTPQTLLYDKSRVVYGLSRAKTEIKAKDMAVVVEGQMDVIACHAAGMKNVVAASGTALTIEQIKLLKRYTNNVSMAFDADSAGENAGKRGATLAMAEGLQVKVIQIPAGAGKDADECLKKDQAVWFKAVANATSLLEWYFRTILKKINHTTAAGKQAVVNALLPEIVAIPYAVERGEWLRRLGDELDLDQAVLHEEVKKVSARPSSSKDSRSSEKPLATVPRDPIEVLAEELWSLLLKFPVHYAKASAELRPEYFANTKLLSLYEIAEDVYTTSHQLDVTVLRQRIGVEANGESMVDVLEMRPYRNFDDISAVDAGQEI